MARRRAGGADDEGTDPEEVSVKEHGDIQELSWVSDKEIRTVDDALAYGKVDTSVWYVDRFECAGWNTSMKLSAGQDERGRWGKDRPVKKQQWRIKVWLKRILPNPFAIAHEALYERIKKAAPRYPRLAARRLCERSHLLEVDLFDAHFGKLAWAAETGQDYDLKIAEKLYKHAVEDIVSRAKGFRIDRIVLPVGSDFFHVDGLESSTTRGTRVDSDGRYAKIIEVGEMAVVEAVEFLSALAPVQVLWIPGNHDRVASYHLSRFVSAWFRNCKRVTVDCSPKTRKYVRFGVNLIGYAHGDTAKMNALPMLMPLEERKQWGETTVNEWRTGHTHKAKQLSTVSVDTCNGVIVRALRCLSATDAWHYDQGYVGGSRAAEGFVMGHDDGFVAHLGANIRE